VEIGPLGHGVTLSVRFATAASCRRYLEAVHGEAVEQPACEQACCQREEHEQHLREREPPEQEALLDRAWVLEHEQHQQTGDEGCESKDLRFQAIAKRRDVRRCRPS
jgi:hypothetical protein